MPWVALPDSLQLCKISGCLYTPYVQDRRYLASFIVDNTPLKTLLGIHGYWVLFIWGLIEVGMPTRPTWGRPYQTPCSHEVFHFIQSRPRLNFLFFWASNQPCCLLQCSGTILRVRPRCPLIFLVVPTGWETFFSSRRYSTYSLPFLFWIIISDILPTTMLGYYSKSASLIPSEIFSSSFWSIGSLLPIGRHSTSLRSQGCKQVGC
jgi:hypothetical protein